MPTADPPFVHLHVHSDYSVLDGACKIDRLLDVVEEMGQPAVALTDHGVMSGAVELYRKATNARHHAGGRPRGLRGPRPRRAAEPRAAQPPDAARRDHRGLLQPHQALLGRLPRGLPPQAAHLARAHGAPRRRHHRPLRMPLRRRLLQPGARRRDGRARRARHAGPDLRARRRLRGGPARGAGRPDRHQRPACARWPWTPGCRWSRPATRTTRAARTPTRTRPSWPSRRATC